MLSIKKMWQCMRQSERMIPMRTATVIEPDDAPAATVDALTAKRRPDDAFNADSQMAHT
jgi:hypothetical protein